MGNFTTNVILQVKDGLIYDGLTHQISQWWTETFEGSAHEEGQTFTIRFGSQVYKTMIVEKLIKNRNVIWRVEDALIDLDELVNKREWINTCIIWDILPTSNGTSLTITHIGLTPEIECYELCTSGWQSFLYSLDKFLTTGVGTPFRLVDTD